MAASAHVHTEPLHFLNAASEVLQRLGQACNRNQIAAICVLKVLVWFVVCYWHRDFPILTYWPKRSCVVVLYLFQLVSKHGPTLEAFNIAIDAGTLPFYWYFQIIYLLLIKEMRWWHMIRIFGQCSRTMMDVGEHETILPVIIDKIYRFLQ